MAPWPPFLPSGYAPDYLINAALPLEAGCSASRSRLQSRARNAPSATILILTYILSLTVSKLPQLTYQICASDGVHLFNFFNTLVRCEPLNSGPTKFVLKKLETSLHRTVLLILYMIISVDAVNAFDRRTDRNAITTSCVANCSRTR